MENTSVEVFDKTTINDNLTKNQTVILLIRSMGKMLKTDPS